MQRMQRKFGTYLPRTADEAQVGTMLHEYEEADKMLAKVINPTEKRVVDEEIFYLSSPKSKLT